MLISNMAQAVQPSLTRQLFNKAQQYNNVVDLTLGDPDIKPDDRIIKAASKAIEEGKTRYSANAGLIALRKAIAKNILDEYKISVDPNEEIIATVGGMEALFLAFAAIVNQGSEVLIQAPYYVNYVQMVRMLGGVPVLIETKEENGFEIDVNDLKKAITDKTVAIVINTPSNPTGRVISEKVLKEIAKLAVEHNLYVISDEVYKTLIFDNKQHASVFTYEGMKERTILIDSFSKRFAMTGYRIGYAIGNSEVIKNMVKMQENVAACAPLPSQYAAIAALENCINDDIKNVYEKRCKLVSKMINQIGTIHCLEPESTFYLFVNVSKTGLKSLEFANKLLEEVQVAVAPGIAYGESYDDYIRIACTLDEKKLEEGANRIKKFVNSLGV